jgi:hypothetical protein
MIEPIPAAEIHNWYRCGRGRCAQVFATDADVLEWLHLGLPARSAPYVLVAAERIPLKQGYGQRAISLPMAGADDSRIIEFLQANLNTWIYSPAITPWVPTDELSPVEVFCSLNGFVLLQHAWRSRRGLEAATIGLVDRVTHRESGEQRAYDGHRVVFNRLRRTIYGALRYTTIQTFRDGSEIEITKPGEGLMTERAFRAAQEGVKFSHRPGRPRA